MPPTFVAEGREPSGPPPQSPTFTGRLAPLRYKKTTTLLGASLFAEESSESSEHSKKSTDTDMTGCLFSEQSLRFEHHALHLHVDNALLGVAAAGDFLLQLRSTCQNRFNL